MDLSSSMVLPLHERMKIEEVWGENMIVKTYDATSKAFLLILNSKEVVKGQNVKLFPKSPKISTMYRRKMPQ